MNNFWKDIKKPIKILAPMEDITDTVFRQLISKWGRPDVFFTEFTNAEGLGSIGNEKVIHRWKYTEKERPIVAQIWGTNPKMHYESAKMAVALGFDGIDINMGCPVKKIIKKGTCSALIEHPILGSEVIAATIEGAGNLPISVKTRIGFKEIETEKWITFLLNQNLQAITIHGRIAIDKKKSPANWDEIKKAVEIRDALKKNTLIIGNGDVKSLEEIHTKADEYGVDGVMIGRGILEDVFLFHKKTSFNDLTKPQKIVLLLEHLKLFDKTWTGIKNYSKMKKYFKIYIKGFNGAPEFRNQLMKTTNIKEAINILLVSAAGFEPATY